MISARLRAAKSLKTWSTRILSRNAKLRWDFRSFPTTHPVGPVSSTDVTLQTNQVPLLWVRFFCFLFALLYVFFYWSLVVNEGCFFSRLCWSALLFHHPVIFCVVRLADKVDAGHMRTCVHFMHPLMRTRTKRLCSVLTLSPPWLVCFRVKAH